MKHLYYLLISAFLIPASVNSQTIEWFDTPTGQDSMYWDYFDYTIPAGMKIDSVFGAFLSPNWPADQEDYYFRFCDSNDTSCVNPIYPWDYATEQNSLYGYWIDLTAHSFTDGNVRVGLPTFGGWHDSFDTLFYLPDGSGQQYVTDLNVTGFDTAAVVTTGIDLQQLCVTMEHSYLGDLEMVLRCPNGQSVTVFNSYGPGGMVSGGFNGGATYMGDPMDNNIGNPGVGWEYCFDSNNPTLGTLGAEFSLNNTVMSTISNGSSMNPNGVYNLEEPFDNLAGCPLNGTWTLIIQDNLSIDDGYIFGWSLLMDPVNGGLDHAVWDSVGFALSTHVGLGENQLSDQIFLSPNPTDGILHVNKGSEQLVNVDIFNMIGEMVASEANAAAVDISAFDAGIYIAIIRNSEGKLIGRERIVLQ